MFLCLPKTRLCLLGRRKDKNLHHRHISHLLLLVYILLMNWNYYQFVWSHPAPFTRYHWPTLLGWYFSKWVFVCHLWHLWKHILQLTIIWETFPGERLCFVFDLFCIVFCIYTCLISSKWKHLLLYHLYNVLA